MIIKNIEYYSLNKKEILLREYIDIKNKTIEEISRQFTKNKCDILVITKKQKPYYVITSQDLIDALVSHFDNIKISLYIEKNPKKIISVDENETVFEAYRLMRSYQIHHLVVVDEHGNFRAVINFYDFASYLTEIALKDEMTGLYNKRFFEFILDRYKNEDMSIGIIFIDLNNFKQINDVFGHIFGDQVLKEVADIIKKSIRNIDYAFRFGGDEFVVLVFSEYEELKKIALRMEEKISKTIVEGIKIDCSVGFAHYPTDSNNIYKVLEIADKRMYEDKKRKKLRIK